MELKYNIVFQLIFLIFIFLHTFIIIISFYLYYKKKYQIKLESKFIGYWNLFIYNTYKQPLNYLFELIAPDLPYSAKFIIFITEQAEKNKFYGWILRNSYIIFNYFPRFIVLMIFSYDILFLEKIKYFPYSLILLLIPVSYHIYLKLCYSFSRRNIPEVEQYLDIQPEGIMHTNGHYDKYSFALKAKYKPDSKLLEEYSYYWYLLFRLQNYVLFLEQKEEDNNFYVNVIFSSLYLIVGVYRFLLIL